MNSTAMPAEILTSFAQRCVFLHLEGDDLAATIRNGPPLTDSERALIRVHKPELIDRLRREDRVSSWYVIQPRTVRLAISKRAGRTEQGFFDAVERAMSTA